MKTLPLPLTPLRQRMVEDMRLRNSSAHTIRAYLHCVADFAKHCGTSPSILTRSKSAPINSFWSNASAPSEARLCQSGAGPDPGSLGQTPGTACCVVEGNDNGEAYTGR